MSWFFNGRRLLSFKQTKVSASSGHGGLVSPRKVTVVTIPPLLLKRTHRLGKRVESAGPCRLNGYMHPWSLHTQVKCGLLSNKDGLQRRFLPFQGKGFLTYIYFLLNLELVSKFSLRTLSFMGRVTNGT